MAGAGSTGNLSPWSKPGLGTGPDARRRAGAPIMHPTQFWTGGVPLGASIEVVSKKPWPQRVLMQDLGGNVFVSDAPNARVGPRAIDVQAFPQVIVLAPGQTLYASAALVGGVLGLAISAAIPAGFHRRTGQSFFGAMPPGQLVDPKDIPQRVTVTLPAGSTGQVSADPRLVAQPAPQGNSTRITAVQFYVIVLAPQQALYGILTAGAGPFAISASDLVSGPGVSRGPTGIPGPDGQE